MNKSIICCIFGLLVALQSVAADDSMKIETIPTIEEFQKNIQKAVNKSNLTCENFDEAYCKQSSPENDMAYQRFCRFVLNGYLCNNEREGAGLLQLYKDSLAYIYKESIKMQQIVDHAPTEGKVKNVTDRMELSTGAEGEGDKHAI